MVKVWVRVWVGFPFTPITTVGSISVRLKPSVLVERSNTELGCLHLLKRQPFQRDFPEYTKIQKETGETSFST